MSETKVKSKKKTKKILYNVCLVILGLVFVGCAAYLIKYYLETKKYENRFDELEAMIIPEEEIEEAVVDEKTDDSKPKKKQTIYVDIDGVLVQKKFEKLYRGNKDFVGWMKIAGTDINYPVMQSMYDEQYYINRDYDKNYSGAGSLFVDTSSDLESSDNIIIYGHNMESGKMFHELLKYDDEDYYKEHKYITFDTIHGNATYEVIAAFRSKIYYIESDDFKYYEFFDAENEKEYNDYVNNVKALTPYNIPTTAKYGDQLITLSTCAYHTKNGRLAVVAKKLEEQ